MPLTYSIAYGLIAGIGTWIVLQGTFYLLSLVGVQKPSWDAPEEESPMVLAGKAAKEPSEEVSEEAEKKTPSAEGSDDKIEEA